VSVEHKRPLYAFILVAVVCGIVIGQTLRSQGLEGVLRPFERPMAIITGSSFAPATAGEPVQAETRTVAAQGSAHGNLRGGNRDDRTLAGSLNRNAAHRPGPNEHAWPAFCSGYPGWGQDDAPDSSDDSAGDANGDTDGDADGDAESTQAQARQPGGDQSSPEQSADQSSPDQSRAQARRDARAHRSDVREWALHLGLPWRFDFCGDAQAISDARSH
jgi:hypothetical protein